MLEPFFTFLEVNFSRNWGGTSSCCTTGETQTTAGVQYRATALCGAWALPLPPGPDPTGPGQLSLQPVSSVLFSFHLMAIPIPPCRASGTPLLVRTWLTCCRLFFWVSGA